ncbi:F-box domain-containing protein [Mycena chlorophos]|uniref:F-box domain-containing protein n=1 Tax=Mycena chlorophos TaxID=658473 RepID=A0A8H6SKK0_MYCCL|nr:F-box domain-containing protein [Mycena chlorophos]
MARHRSLLRPKRPRLESASSLDSFPDLMGQPTTATRPLPHNITSRLPTELYDHFFHELHASKTTLATCSLVCKAWLDHARRYLFSTVNLRSDSRRRFVSFLRDSPHIIGFIRHVRMGGGWMLEQRDEFNDMIRFLINLDNLRNIDIEAWSWSYLSPETAGVLLGGKGKIFETLAILDLTFITFPTFDTFRTVVSQFQMLRQLSLDNVTWGDEDKPESDLNTPALAPPLLSRLSICACSSQSIVRWLMDAAEVPPIRSLRMPEVLADEVSLVNDLLAAIGPSLEHLEIGFLDRNSDDAPAVASAVAQLDLSVHTRLRTLRIDQLTLYRFPSSPSSASSASDVSPCVWLVPLLESTSSPLLSELTLAVWLGEESQLDSIDWKALVAFLERGVQSASTPIPCARNRRRIGRGGPRLDFSPSARLGAW